jgi:hypothetical protein
LTEVCVLFRLNRIQFPGSHDAGSYWLNPHNGYGNPPPAFGGAAPPPFVAAGGKMYRHSSSSSAITQSYTLLDQLCLVCSPACIDLVLSPLSVASYR